MIPGVDFELDTFHLEIVTRGEKSAELDPATIERLGEEHIDYRVKLRADGLMLAAGAVVGAAASRNVETGNPVVGLGFWSLPRDRVLELIAEDPGDRAGLYRSELVEYECPKGALRFEEP